MPSIIHKQLCKQRPVIGESKQGQALVFHLNELTCPPIDVTRISSTKEIGKAKRKAVPVLN
jgi:hypothetical protein